MSALIRLFWNICLFRRGPQDTPYSPTLFGILLILNLAFDFVALLVPDTKGETLPLSLVIPFLLAQFLMLLTVVNLVLWMHGHSARVLQTLTTMFGVEIILDLALVPLQVLAMFLGEQSALVAFFYLGLMAFFIWSLAIHTHIFRHALSTSIFTAGSYALMLFILSLVIRFQMLPVSG